jgi:tetratricopeptide (TPR) repeat protein
MSKHKSHVENQPSHPRLSLLKRLIFSGVAILLSFGLIELILLLLGVKPESFMPDPYVGFESTSRLFVESGTHLETSPQRLQLFNQQSFARDKQNNVFRIFSMGGSTTFGRPYRDQTSFNGWMRAFLKVMVPDKEIEVINAGGVSYASYRVAKLMEELSEYQPDLFVVYTGHNEFLEDRIYHKLPQIPNSLKPLTRFARRLRSATLLKRAVNPWIRSGQEDKSVSKLLKGDVDAILDHTKGPDTYKRDKDGQEKVLKHFEFNLHRMVDIATSVGAKVVFVNPSSNLRDVTPFKSSFDSSLSKEEQQTWQSHYDRARDAFERRDPVVTFAALEEAEKIDPMPALLHFSKGRALEATGKFDKAKESYMKAKDEDVCPLRALSPVSEIIRQVGTEYNIPIVDFIKIQETHSPNGIPGASVFLDHVHPTIESHRLLALEIIRTLESEGWIKPLWNEQSITAVTQDVLSGIEPGEHGVAMMNLSKVFGWAGKHQAAYQAILKGLEIAPDSISMQYQAGLAAHLVGRSDEAKTHYQQALEKNPAHANAHCNLGLLLEEEGLYESAVHHFRLALQHGDPSNRQRDQFNLDSAMSKMTEGKTSENLQP